MRVFKEGNWGTKKDKIVCPICKTQKEGEVVLIGIDGTQEGHNIEAKQFHLACLDLIYYTDVGDGLICQRF